MSVEDVHSAIQEKTGGRGADGCIDAVGLEAHGHTVGAAYDRAKTFLGLNTDQITVVRQAVQACRKGGVVSLPGVYGGLPDKFPLGAAFSKGLTFKMGQTHVHKYLAKLLGHIQNQDIDPSFVITHRMRLEEAPLGYSTFHNDPQECIKVVLKP